SLRYRNVDPQTWRVMLYRNYPRDFHYQFFTARLPRDSNCFVCRANVLTGLEHLPSGGHLVVAPYVAASDVAEAPGAVGSSLGADDDGGGSAVIPGPTNSSLAAVDFGSTVFVARAKRDVGLSFVSVLATDREHHRGGRPFADEGDDSGHNRVVGPDFTWRPSG